MSTQTADTALEAPAPTAQELASEIVQFLLGVARAQKQELAPVIGISPSGVGRAIKGHRAWTPQNLADMAAFFSERIGREIGPGIFFRTVDEVLDGQNWKVLSRSRLTVIDGEAYGPDRPPRFAPHREVTRPTLYLLPGGEQENMLGDTIGDYLNWLRWRNLRASSIQQRLYTLRRFTRHTGVHPLDATPQDILKFRDRPSLRGGPLAAESQAAELAHLAGFYRWAVLEGHPGGRPDAPGSPAEAAPRSAPPDPGA